MYGRYGPAYRFTCWVIFSFFVSWSGPAVASSAYTEDKVRSHVKATFDSDETFSIHTQDNLLFFFQEEHRKYLSDVLEKIAEASKRKLQPTSKISEAHVIFLMYQSKNELVEASNLIGDFFDGDVSRAESYISNRSEKNFVRNTASYRSGSIRERTLSVVKVEKHPTDYRSVVVSALVSTVANIGRSSSADTSIFGIPPKLEENGEVSELDKALLLNVFAITPQTEVKMRDLAEPLADWTVQVLRDRNKLVP